MDMGRAEKRILSTALAAALGIGALFVGAPQAMLTVSAAAAHLGTLTHYNGILFSSIIGHQADVEGALAVGGDSTFGSAGHSYDVGGAVPYHSTVHIGRYTNPNNYPTLLLGGMPQFKVNQGGHVGVAGGPVVMPSSIRGSYSLLSTTFSGTVSFEQDSLLEEFFDQAYDIIDNTSRKLPEANTAAAISYQDFARGNYSANLGAYVNQSLPLPGEAGNAISINVDGGYVVNIGEVSLPSGLAAYDTVVFNFVGANEIHFGGGAIFAEGKMINTSAPPGVWHRNIDYAAANALLKKYAQKVIWNFPDAEAIEIKGKGIVGSVLAPEADVVATGGSINGMLVADMLEQKGGFELHAFTMRSVFMAPDPDEEELGRIRVIKADADDRDIQLLGAEFDLYRDSKSGAPYRSGLTVDSVTKALDIEDLPAGSYILVETKAPPGYELSATDLHFIIDEQNGMGPGADTYIRYFDNTAKKITVTGLEKRDITDDSPLDDAVFALYLEDEDGSRHYVREIESESGGQIRIPDLAVGTYHLVEISPPDGYLIVDAYRYITIVVSLDAAGNLVTTISDRDGNPLPGSVIYNEPASVTSELYVQVVKLDYDDNTLAVEGAEFQLQYFDPILGWSDVGAYTTDRFGMIYPDPLREGDYQFREVRLPDGYTFVTESGGAIPSGVWIPFTVYDKGGGYLALGYSGADGVPGVRALNLISLYNKPNGSIDIVKVDANDYSSRLAGAEFILYRSHFGGVDVVADNLVTGANGELRVDGLPPGRYFLEETKAPVGYQRELAPTNPWMITLGYGGGATMHYSLTIPNTPVDIQLDIIKVDADNPGVTLAGAVFDLYRFEPTGRDWMFIDTLVTGADGRIPIETIDMAKLSRGTYKFVEVRAPDGYAGALEYEDQEYVFNVNYDPKNPTLTLGTYYVKNARDGTLGKVEIVKIERLPNYNTLLEGAVFRLYHRGPGDTDYYEVQSGLTTDPTGRITVGGLAVGDYILMETKAPAGYQLAVTPIEFTVTADSRGQVLELPSITVENKRDTTITSPPPPPGGGSGSSGGGGRQDTDRVERSLTGDSTPLAEPTYVPVDSPGRPDNPSTGAVAAVLGAYLASGGLIGSGVYLLRSRRRWKK